MPPEEHFRCIACTESVSLLASFSAVTSHFLSAHGVSSLLGGPGIRAVLLPRTLAEHKCLLCGEKLLGSKKLEKHIGDKHGEFFLERWQQYSSTHCRYGLNVLVHS